MWDRSICEDNARYKRSAEMFPEVQCHSCWNQRYFQRLLITSEQTTFKLMTFDFLYHAFV